MKKNLYFILLAISALLLASLACQAVAGGESPAPTPAAEQPGSEPSPEPATQATAKPQQPPAVAAPGGGGLACLGTRDSGVVCLDDSGWKTYTQDNSQLPSNYISAVTTCPDGRIAFGHFDGISLFDGQNWSNIANGDYTSMDALACGADGQLWVAHFQGVSHYDGSQWEKFEAAKLATGDSASDLVYDIAIAPDGTVWAVTSNSVASYNGSDWTIYQQGQGFDEKFYFNAVTFDGQGRTVVSQSNGLAIFDGGQWSLNNSPDFLSTVEDMAAAADGSLWLGTLIDGVYIVTDGSWNSQTFEETDLSSNGISAVAADTGGRIWVATEFGLSIYDGAQWQAYHMDNSDLPVNDLRGVAVLGAGPSLPAPTEKAPGTLTGVVKNTDGTPVANSAVEICVETLGTQFFGDTPCSDQPFFLTGTTDGDGKFTFENVPAGYYTIVMQVGDGWAQLTGEFGGFSEQVLVTSGETSDVGDITMKE